TQETTQEKILLCVQKDPGITRRQMAEEVGISEDGIKYHLTKMREGGILRHIGPTKAGYWEIQNSSGDDKS
ncbi:winged helix-turn-helix domain-containing protein, partial [Myxococcota bacterium]|nr:winged helix-turn-helix domain-containing protein [Myxococcota bacterium]